ncbi:N-acetylmuramoyl-L-alanine amidase [Abyssicoccus albus]|uniref:N-acetylmuramoyl-L-alanine amidase n=1 Tax=Abyssicoccus albus TaxID=1817405 RepID=A0A3N5CIX5_9BACL|nr:N-acetylmuramoyl-L-alanine amidase [Abyssicoccus albus]RPF57631.1 N-acetylmuramoyl-L-alanine amidase [Abyssicoccus albus]
MKITKMLLPISHRNRTKQVMRPKYITIHNTGNSSKGANALMHAKYIKNQQHRYVSWHYTIDDQYIIQHVPSNEVAWHAGDGAMGLGNISSIGIEMCQHDGVDFEQVIQNTIELVRLLMKQYDIPIHRVVPHSHWKQTSCPKFLLEYMSFDQFRAMIIEIQMNKPKYIKVTTQDLWVYDKPQWNARYKIVHKGEVFTIKNKLSVDGYTMYELKSGLFITGAKEYIELI